MTLASKRCQGALFVAPFMFLLITMQLAPLAVSFALSLTRSDLFGVEAWVGFQNYRRLAGDALLGRAAANTAIFVVMSVPALIGLGLMLALALNRPGKWSTLLRAIFFVPTVLSVSVVTLIWRLMYAPDGGLFASIARLLHRVPVPFLNEEQLALPAIAVTTVWWSVGVPMVWFLATLQQIPGFLYDAAVLDGASPWGRFRAVTFPALRRSLAAVLTLEVVLQFQLFGQSQLMTEGGPNNASLSLVLFVYDAAWHDWMLGYAAAGAMALFVIIFCFAGMGYWALSRVGSE